jgi:hypothetical protein
VFNDDQHSIPFDWFAIRYYRYLHFGGRFSIGVRSSCPIKHIKIVIDYDLFSGHHRGKDMRECMQNKCGSERVAYVKKYRKLFGKSIGSCWKDNEQNCETLFEQKFDSDVRRSLTNQIRARNNTQNLDYQLAVLMRAYLKMVETLRKKSRPDSNDDSPDYDTDSESDDDYDSDQTNEGDGTSLYALQLGEYGSALTVDTGKLGGLEEQSKAISAAFDTSESTPNRLDQMSDRQIVDRIKRLHMNVCSYSNCEFPRILLMASLSERNKYLDCGAKHCPKQYEEVMRKFDTFKIVMEALHLNPIKRMSRKFEVGKSKTTKRNEIQSQKSSKSELKKESEAIGQKASARTTIDKDAERTDPLDEEGHWIFNV